MMDNYKALQRGYDHQEEAEKAVQEASNVHDFISNFEYELSEITSDNMKWSDVTKLLREQLKIAEKEGLYYD